MLEIRQITPAELLENRQNVDEYLKNEFTQLVNEKTWMNNYDHLIRRFQLQKFKKFTYDEFSNFQWDTKHVKELSTETFRRVNQYLDFDSVRITIVPSLPFSYFKEQPKPLWINAFTNGPGNIVIAIPPQPDDDFFQYLLAHELHHACPSNPIYHLSLDSFTLEEWFKMEGTAEFFSLSLFPDKRWWKDNLSGNLENSYWNKIKEHLKSTDDHVKSDLCFGNSEKGIPIFAGYSFALKVVSHYANKHQLEDINKLFLVKASEMMDDYWND
ncbi:DUF2268 domain-containing putative Zn-dependent protease [Chungangia koreensis]|uniref:DUF2268 domain-containing putative Zn-dependent protease n=1 Tax=Chungangia koreensis TaxID=752657 RepID=A0ABV8X0L9_9LACT